MTFLLIRAINVFFQVVYYLLLARILMSWFPGAGDTRIGVFLYNMTEPIVGPFRKMIDDSPIAGGMMLDFSPIIAFFVLDIVKRVLISLVAML